jgi:predicted SAM-dependent methyltransferase
MVYTLKNYIKKVMPMQLIPLFKKGLEEVSTSLKHHKGVIHARKYSLQNNLKINFGCGSVIKRDWINIDLCKGVDLTLDLRKRLPFLDNSCVIVYSEHFFEHLNYPDSAMLFLKECYRVLKPGGIFSVGVPDTEWPLRAYAGLDNANYFKYAKERWHPQCTTKMEHINYHFRQNGQHLFAYDFETLKYILEKCGFRNVKRRNFDSSLDRKYRELGTLYVNAIKPV